VTGEIPGVVSITHEPGYFNSFIMSPSAIIISYILVVANYIAIVFAVIKVIASAIRAKAYNGSEAFRMWAMQLKSPRYAVLTLGILTSIMFIRSNSVFLESRKYFLIESVLSLFSMIAFLILASFWINAHARQEPGEAQYAKIFSYGLIPVSGMVILCFIGYVLALRLDTSPYIHYQTILVIDTIISIVLVVGVGLIPILAGAVNAAMRVWSYIRARYMQAERLPQDPVAEGVKRYLDKISIHLAIIWFGILVRGVFSVLFLNMINLVYDNVAYGILLLLYKLFTTTMAIALISASLQELLKFGTEAMDSEAMEHDDDDEGQELLV